MSYTTLASTLALHAVPAAPSDRSSILVHFLPHPVATCRESPHKCTHQPQPSSFGSVAVEHCYHESSTDAVDAATVRATADAVINDQDHALAALGPIAELPDYNYVRRRSYWLRH